ncbi:hypothetical protein [Mycobacteroides abscessus]|uniref:hypothetical protein n=1 Tax=Mycobacteroides abscessus TaxID=36809 RepID=UPI0009439A5C|nr:hypothetical protein [Mycobacteroides abscessus]MDO3333021.1 hypothetical protein [Mycobacteroides abscessus subsp. bolletii]QSM89531.1 hypothetical protein I3U44_01915 [Mycobacteroides abscessus subsp. bolletii]
MSSENARSWIKDGPMKEYNRARLGAGRYAQFGSASSLQVEHLIAHIFESSTSIVEGSQGVKPFHCLVIADGLKTYMAWDLARNLRYLVWASVNYLADHPQDSACIVLLETMEHPIPYAEKLRHARIAERFSIKIGYYRMDHQRMVGGDQL